MKRRTFFGGAFAGLAATAYGLKPPKASAGDIPKRTFGKTGEKLTVIGQAGGRFPLITFEEAKAVTLRAYDLGINYFDNSVDYWDGKSEEVFGAVLPPFRKNIFITTKANKRDRAGAEGELHLSLKRMRLDYVDLWQIHMVGEMKEVDQIFAPGGAIEAFEAAKKAGKCRFIGFTGHRDPNIHLAMLKHYDKFDTILMPLNVADPELFEFRKTRPAGGRRTRHGHSGHEELWQRQTHAGLQRERMPEICPELAHKLYGDWLHNHRPVGGRCPLRPGVQAVSLPLR